MSPNRCKPYAYWFESPVVVIINYDKLYIIIIYVNSKIYIQIISQINNNKLVKILHIYAQ